MSDRTKLCKKRAIIFRVISTILWVAAAVFGVTSVFLKCGGVSVGTSTAIISDSFKTTLISLGTTAIIALILTIFMSNKMRMTIWMASVILSTIVYGETAMYIMFSIWFIDEYIFNALAIKYKQKYTINKEIDLR